MARKRRLRTLLVLWAAYWAGLVAWEAGPVFLEYVRLQATAGHGTVSWSFSGSLTMLALAIFGPPLALWAIWLLVPERRDARREARMAPGDPERNAPELAGGVPFAGVPPEHEARARLPVDEEPPRA